MQTPPPAKSQPRSLRTLLLRVPGALGLWKAMRDTPTRVADMRRSYTLAGLEEKDLAADPIEQFRVWFAAAVESTQKPAEPNAMTLATCGEDGAPEARTVLLKGFDAAGFVFFTNYESRKGRALAARPRASLLFFWPQLERQIEVRGAVVRVSPEETAAYFRSRPAGSQIGAWASRQSQVLASRGELEERAAELMRTYGGREIPVPPHWGGFRVVPESLEFWQGRPSRLHDRLRYRRNADGAWGVERLSP